MGTGLRTALLSSLMAGLVVAPIAVASALPESLPRAPTSPLVSVPTPSRTVTTLPPFVEGPVVIIRPLEARRIRDPHAGTPLRVVIRGMGSSAPVIPIDAAGGVLTPPGDPNVFGWWSPGAVPGAAHGSALITGHTVHAGEAPMNDLASVPLGSVVLVRTINGVVRYRVTLVRVFRKASLARSAGEVFDQSVPGRLVLITCEDWNGSEYLSNTVVFAVPFRTK